MVSSSRGLTFIEVLVALAFFAISLAAFTSLLVQTMRVNSQARHMTTATTLAQEKLEELRTTANPVDGTDNVDERGGAGGYYARQWDVTAGVPTPTSNTVSVTVTWGEDAEHSIQLETILSQ